ncbi:MAG: PorT family protein [Bacteroidales bacterium]|jgi:hypothetical protein|nr:PorT family protein [Bacteroidales bacterium]
MKKLLLVLTLFISGWIHPGIKAQYNISVGFKSSAIGFDYIMKHKNGHSSDMRFGVSLGGMIPVEISNHFIVQPEFNVYYRSNMIKNDMDGTSRELMICGAEIPIYALYRWGSDNSSIHMGAGIYLGAGFIASDRTNDIDLYDEEYLKRMDFGLGYMIGYRFKFGLSLQLEYKIGVLNALTSQNNNNKMYPQSVGIGLGYIFPAIKPKFTGQALSEL